MHENILLPECTYCTVCTMLIIQIDPIYFKWWQIPLSIYELELFITGDEKECDVCFCDCTSGANILLAHGLWPASPTTPVLAVEIPLMDFLESLFLESQVSLSSFCNAIKWKNIIY